MNLYTKERMKSAICSYIYQLPCPHTASSLHLVCSLLYVLYTLLEDAILDFIQEHSKWLRLRRSVLSTVAPLI